MKKTETHLISLATGKTVCGKVARNSSTLSIEWIAKVSCSICKS